MKPSLLMFCCAFLMGCDYSVPLVVHPQHTIDPALVGRWERALPNQEREAVLILPWDDHAYLVVFPANKPHAMYAKACLAPVADLPLFQLKWFGTADAKQPTNSRVYQFVTVDRQGDHITVRILNSERISTALTTSDALVQAITQHKDHPNLFREPICFSRISERTTP